VGEVVQRAGAHGDADAFRQCHRRRLMAHVRTVRQVVGAIGPRKQPVHERGLERSAPGGIEHGAVRIERTQFAPDLLERFRPLHRNILVRCSIPAHRMRQAARGFKMVVVPFLEIRHGVFGKEIRRHPLVRDLPGCRFRAVLTEFEDPRICRLGPGAADAHVAFGLVLLEQDPRPEEWNAIATERFHERLDRAPSSRCGFIGLYLEIGT
jgi:hypothetical protein